MIFSNQSLLFGGFWIDSHDNNRSASNSAAIQAAQAKANR
jgi:hypothetical protein